MSRQSVRSFVFKGNGCGKGEFVSFKDAGNMAVAQTIVREFGWYSGVGDLEFCPPCGNKVLAGTMKIPKDG